MNGAPVPLDTPHPLTFGACLLLSPAAQKLSTLTPQLLASCLAKCLPRSVG